MQARVGVHLLLWHDHLLCYCIISILIWSTELVVSLQNVKPLTTKCINSEQFFRPVKICIFGPKVICQDTL